MTKIYVPDALKMREEGMSLLEISKRFDVSPQAVHAALKKPPKFTDQAQQTEVTLESMTEWAIRAAQALTDEPFKDSIINTQATQIKVLKARLAKEENRNKKSWDHERLFEKAKKGKLPKSRRKSDSNFTYHITLYDPKLVNLIATKPLTLNISEGAFCFN